MQISQPAIASRASRAADRRRHLIDVARRLFGEQGFHATGVAQIAAASGVRVGQLYRDFASKEDLIAAMVAQNLAQFLDEDGLRTAVEAEDAVAVRAWLDRFFAVEKSIEDCRMMAEIHSEAARNARIADIHAGVDRTVRDQIMTALGVLIPGTAAAMRRDEVGNLIMLLGNGLMSRRVVDRDVDAPRLARTVVRIVDAELAASVAACCPDAGGGSGRGVDPVVDRLERAAV